MSEKDIFQTINDQAAQGDAIFMIILIRRVAPGVFEPVVDPRILFNRSMLKHLDEFRAGEGQFFGMEFMVLGGMPHVHDSGAVVVAGDVRESKLEQQIMDAVLQRLRDSVPGRGTSTLYMTPADAEPNAIGHDGTLLARASFRSSH